MGNEAAERAYPSPFGALCTPGTRWRNIHVSGTKPFPELGLGPLLERMPGGLFQMVGDTGWQLSHGERSRIYIARAVLQNPDVLILDESFAALDPELFRSSIDYLLQRDSALVLIAHP